MKELSLASCSRSSIDPMEGGVKGENRKIRTQVLVTEGSRVQITDHFCSEGELPLKGREVGEEAVILKEDVQVNAVGDSESCVRGLRNTHAFCVAFYAYQCSRPTNTTVVVEGTEIVVVLVQVMKSQDSRPHAHCAVCAWRSLSPSAAAPTQ